MKTSIAEKIELFILLALLSVALASQSKAGDFTTETIIEETVYQSLHVIDASQTVYIAKHPDQFYEKESDFIIGRHPSEASVIKFMAADALVHVAVTTALVKLDAPRWVTRTWEILTIADTANCVRGNFKIGIKARF